MLVGIGLLSLAFAYLTRWRQNIWPAVIAHALFDAIQLLVVVPFALRLLEEGEGASWLPVAWRGLGAVSAIW
jgi:membrane protease YdiL (CAAX protease family)